MAASLWPWLALAGLGALHGLNPASGWMFAAAWGLRADPQARAAQVRRALWPLALGHAASVALVAIALAQGLSLERGRLQGLAGALLVGLASLGWLRGAGPCTPLGGPGGMALWSCLMATVHGAGLMLVPALVPLCLSDGPARALTASGSLALAGAAVAVHMAALLLTTGVIATGVCRGIARQPRLLSGAASHHARAAALAVTGVLLMVLR